MITNPLISGKEIFSRRTPRSFALVAPFAPAGDQPQAISAITHSLENGVRDTVLLGVTGSGKTFTMANVIQNVQRTTLILAPNKILAAQLFGEMKDFFPHNAVEYFVSYYDYYRPEAYIPRTNTFVKKEATINENIERMRHSATRSLLERTDVIVVASVSCIYGLGAIESYEALSFTLTQGQNMAPLSIMRQLSTLAYVRNDVEFARGSFRLRGEVLDIFPAHYENRAWRVAFFGKTIENIYEIDVVTGKVLHGLESICVYPNNHYITPGPTMSQAIVGIGQELHQRVTELKQQNKLLEAQRLEERVTFDLEALKTTGICAGIENYSRYLTGRPAGSAPPTLFEYLPPDALLIVDESHVALPQLRAMYVGDAARKSTLAEYGFRLPSCVDNRPLRFDEWDEMRPMTLYVSATPGPWEQERATHVIEQALRPTGLLDPECFVFPCADQIQHLQQACTQVIAEGGRILITTLTKKMAEDLSDYFLTHHFRARYMHADVDTLDRIQLIADLRKGEFDILIGINLLREGLDIPECALVAILDADKEGYLRCTTSLIQTMGRAARNVKGRVFLYADRMTVSMEKAIEETQRRRSLQHAYNETHGIIPRSAGIAMRAAAGAMEDRLQTSLQDRYAHLSIQDIEAKMLSAAEALDFEAAATFKQILHQRRENA